jgi:hypothetical protein
MKEMKGSREEFEAKTFERNVWPRVFEPVVCWTA